MSLSSEADNILEPILLALQSQLQIMLIGHAVNVYLKGSAEMTSWGRTKKGLKKLFEGPPVQEAINYARIRSASMVTKIDEGTRERLRELITNGIEEKRGIPGLARDIRKEFTYMSKYRSQLIAKTETAEALGQAFEDRSKAMGVTGKEWIDSGDGKVSEGCLANAAAGVIPIDEPFPSGHMRHPRFPGCRCAVIPVMLS